MSVTDIGADKRIFLRKASGLIRTAGLTDTFIYNLGVVSIGLGVGSMLYYGPAFYPQGDLIWACIIAGVAMAMISFGFITWTITLPRSGGIYVFGSRILPPALALTMSLVEITAWLFYCAIAAYWIVILASGADVCRTQPAHRQRDVPHHLEDHARAVGDVLDRRGDPASVPGRALLRDALLSHPQQMGVHPGDGEHGVPHRRARHVDARAVRGQSQRADRPLARRARRLQRDHRQRQGEGLGRSRLRSLADDLGVQLAVPAVDRRGLLDRHRRRNQVGAKSRRPSACSAPCSSPRWRW